MVAPDDTRQEAESQHLRATQSKAAVAALRHGKAAVWLRPTVGPQADDTPLLIDEVEQARARLDRFAPALAALFRTSGWDGRIRSPLIDCPKSLIDMAAEVLIKCDHSLPISGSVKARGGIYEVLCHVEEVAEQAGCLGPADPIEKLFEPVCLSALSAREIVVASTGNLGFSIGLAARAFNFEADVHMSREAKGWKKRRLAAIGAKVTEHAGHYSTALAAARSIAKARSTYFVDDEKSRRLFVGYSTAAYELAEQLDQRGIRIGPDRRLIVYLPCGVGGAPGGIAAGLKMIFGADVQVVFVEPIASACVFAALAVGNCEPISVFDIGLDNETIADGLAVPMASPLVLRTIGRNIDGVVAVDDRAMLQWVRRAWREAGLRLEPSAAAGFAAVAPHLKAQRSLAAPDPGIRAIHVVWTTGGSLLPDEEFQAYLKKPRS